MTNYSDFILDYLEGKSTYAPTYRRMYYSETAYNNVTVGVDQNLIGIVGIWKMKVYQHPVFVMDMSNFIDYNSPK